ncbi:ATP-binding protein [Pseudogemmobacter humi]|uniref:histidine kinase n=1 Tax=Pseudogemmobacter humi TaxID=2483812 RepID=A0A3P5XBG0_9RHOB|nr:ATP-binding protein [Pseudogemmobacter humi]VDC32003.1 Sensor protein kinase WalK [Pseudogemmobacter humi]
MSFNLLVASCLAYVIFLFAVAFLVERRSGAGRPGWLRSPLIYTLSLSIYCTAWTFYGAVGYAARSGLEFLTIYLGPTLVFIGWWWILRKLVHIGRQQRVTSIADLISSRFGKSNSLGVIVTLMAIVAVTPYIALQLQSVVLAFDVFARAAPAAEARPAGGQIAIWVAAGLALFTILFGTRNLDAKEQHTGIVTAIAVEAVVKLVALIAVGVFVIWGLSGGVSGIIARIDASSLHDWQLQPGRWTALIFLAGVAVICLPRMFQVIVVENSDDGQLARASWAFPAYLMAMSLFIVPIAVLGIERLPEGANPDMFVLTLPLAEGQGGLAMLAFLGGFSSATSMVIVEAIALATMVSNHIVIPTWLRLRRSGAISEDVRSLVLNARRLSIGIVLALGYGYYRVSGGSGALAAIGLISFVGVAQFLPAMMGGIFWRGATRTGALLGLITGFAAWAYCLFLPSFGAGAFIPAHVMEQGPWGISWLRPEALFGTDMSDPLVHALFWSLLLNSAVFCIGSILSFPGPVERLQSAAFVNVFEGPVGPQRWAQGAAEPEALLVMTQRIMGEEDAQILFETAARAQGKSESMLPDPTPAFLASLEEKLAGSIGAATAHAMISKLVGRDTVTVEDLMVVARESAQLMEHSAQLEEQREELARTATALREANDKLTTLSVQKDAFLSQVSHELRTPMTSIRAFSEILAEGDLPPATVARSGGIIRDEAVRLTRLLDDLLDLSVLESGKVQLSVSLVSVRDMIERAILATEKIKPGRDIAFIRDTTAETIWMRTDADRLTQVFINLIANARKYCDSSHPAIRIAVRVRGGRVRIDVADNGKGIPKASQPVVFEKFWRLPGEARASGAGLGLAICREIVTNLGGTIDYLPGQGGAAFRVALPLRIGEGGGA